MSTALLYYMLMDHDSLKFVSIVYLFSDTINNYL